MRRSHLAAAGLLAAAAGVAWAGAPARNSTLTDPRGPAATPFSYSGELTQGGWIRGRAPAGTISAQLGDRPVTLDSERRFFAAFDRDAGATATLTARLAGGRTVSTALAIAPRAWDIERVDIARTQGKTDEEFLAMRKPELAQIAAARAIESRAEGWRQRFIWPAKGRISG